MSDDTISVRLNFLPSLPTIQLQSAPEYLRFVLKGKGWKNLDALDCPEDLAENSEQVLPARRVGEIGTMLVCGTSGSKQKRFANYMPVSCSLCQAELQDNAKWQAWVAKQAETGLD